MKTIRILCLVTSVYSKILADAANVNPLSIYKAERGPSHLDRQEGMAVRRASESVDNEIDGFAGPSRADLPSRQDHDLRSRSPAVNNAVERRGRIEDLSITSGMQQADEANQRVDVSVKEKSVAMQGAEDHRASTGSFRRTTDRTDSGSADRPVELRARNRASPHERIGSRDTRKASIVNASETVSLTAVHRRHSAGLMGRERAPRQNEQNVVDSTYHDDVAQPKREFSHIQDDAGGSSSVQADGRAGQAGVVDVESKFMADVLKDMHDGLSNEKEEGSMDLPASVKAESGADVDIPLPHDVRALSQKSWKPTGAESLRLGEPRPAGSPAIEAVDSGVSGRGDARAKIAGGVRGLAMEAARQQESTAPDHDIVIGDKDVASKGTEDASWLEKGSSSGDKTTSVHSSRPANKVNEHGAVRLWSAHNDKAGGVAGERHVPDGASTLPAVEDHVERDSSLDKDSLFLHGHLDGLEGRNGVGRQGVLPIDEERSNELVGLDKKEGVFVRLELTPETAETGSRLPQSVAAQSDMQQSYPGHEVNIQAGGSNETFSLESVKASVYSIRAIESEVERNLDDLLHLFDADKKTGTGKFHRAAVGVKSEVADIRAELTRMLEAINSTNDGLGNAAHELERKDAELVKLHALGDAEGAWDMLEVGKVKVDYTTGKIRWHEGATHNNARQGSEGNAAAEAEAQAEAWREELERRKEEWDPALLHLDSNLLRDFVILSMSTALGGVAAAGIGVPDTLGYIIGGMLVGPSGVVVIEKVKQVETFAQFGSIFLLFGHGLTYYSFVRIGGPQSKDYAAQGRMGAFTVLFVVFSGLLVCAAIMGIENSVESIYLSAAATLSSTAMVTEFVAHNQLGDTVFARMVVDLVSVQDLVMCPLLAIPTAIIYAVKESSGNGEAMLPRLAGCGFLLMMFAVFSKKLLPILMRLLVLKDKEKEQSSPRFTLGVVSYCLGIALVCERLNLSHEAGALFAGLVMVDSAHAQKAHACMRPLTSLFGGMYLGSLGMIVNPGFIVSNFGEVIGCVLLLLVIKFGIVAMVMKSFGFSWEASTLAGACMAQVSEISLFFVARAQHLELIHRHHYLVSVATTVILMMASPLVIKGLRRFHKGSGDTVLTPSSGGISNASDKRLALAGEVGSEGIMSWLQSPPRSNSNRKRRLSKDLGLESRIGSANSSLTPTASSEAGQGSTRRRAMVV